LYTEEYYLKEMSPEGIPEMQRSNVVSCIIQTHLALVIFIHNLIALQVQHLNCRAHYDWI
ncbi:hypothetical protein ACMD2_15717, partial [Ananas comosus]